MFLIVRNSLGVICRLSDSRCASHLNPNWIESHRMIRDVMWFAATVTATTAMVNQKRKFCREFISIVVVLRIFTTRVGALILFQFFFSRFFFDSVLDRMVFFRGRFIVSRSSGKSVVFRFGATVNGGLVHILHHFRARFSVVRLRRQLIEFMELECVLLRVFDCNEKFTFFIFFFGISNFRLKNMFQWAAYTIVHLKKSATDNRQSPSDSGTVGVSSIFFFFHFLHFGATKLNRRQQQQRPFKVKWVMNWHDFRAMSMKSWCVRFVLASWKNHCRPRCANMPFVGHASPNGCHDSPRVRWIVIQLQPQIYDPSHEYWRIYWPDWASLVIMHYTVAHKYWNWIRWAIIWTNANIIQRNRCHANEVVVQLYPKMNSR